MVSNLMKKTLYVIIILCFSCGYYSFKGSIPSHINSVVISPIENTTSEFLITDLLNEKLLESFLLENILDIVTFENADSKIDLIIKSITDKPNVYSIDANSQYEIVNEWKISINVQIVWYDLINNQNILDKTINEWVTYSLGVDIGEDNLDNDLDGLIDHEDSDEYGTPREGSLRIILDKISSRIVNELTSTW